VYLDTARLRLICRSIDVGDNDLTAAVGGRGELLDQSFVGSDCRVNVEVA
jgi:hypothetical protein